MSYEINSRVLLLREKLDLNQTEFGASIGVSRGVISNIDLNVVDVSTKPLLLQQICKMHNVNPRWLETGEGEMFLPMDEDDKLYEFVDRVCAMDGDAFKKRMFNALANLSESGWEALEAFLAEYEKANRKEQ